jgi:SpoVK/Ycf46/Vps4 family AAA+-type ATPase/intein/homing endonuclease
MPEELKLKVGELTGREDFGRGIARLDTNTMKKIGVREGDVIEIEGKIKSGAVSIRSYPADVGLNFIRMDGLVRKNCDASIGEYVKVRKSDVKEAKKVTLAPAQKGFMIHISPNLLKQNLFMRPMNKGDIIITNPVFKTRKNHDDIFSIFGIDIEEVFMPMGSETRFLVVKTQPEGITQISDMTEVELLPEAVEVEAARLPSVTYEDIGGLGEIVPKIREMIEIPLRRPEVFERLGVEPPRGVLLHGSPGCLSGEALIAIEDGRLVRIGELGKNLVPGIYVADLPIYPPAHAKAIHVYDVPETVEIITKSGRRLNMTPNHPLMTDKGWVEAEKLEVGNKVKIFNWIPNPSNYVPTNFILNKKRLVNEIKIPQIWDEKLAELVGIFVAEGCMDVRRITFSIHKDENDLRECIISLMFEIFNANVTEAFRKYKAVRNIRIANRGIWDFFRPLWSKEKIIPQEILLSPNSVAARFLRGLFEGDGSVVKKNRHFDRAVTLKSKSRKLLEEVQTILLRWSIRSSIYRDGNEATGIRHVLKIRGRENLRKFKENIGFISKLKNEKLNIQLSSYKRKTPNENVDFEPIKEVRRLKGWQRVYDFEVPTTHSFFSNGILSHNTGKTLIAKAVANEAGANFISVAGPEFMSKFYGESEENLRKIFDEAEKNAPSIIFIDEIDAIAPKREQVVGEVERRVVSTLLTQMDGLKSRGKVIVIAATNIPNMLDPALRRTGRFDREIEIPIPDKKGRKEILQIHTRRMPLDKDVDLEKLAEITYGYVGADIAGLAKEAAMHALRRVIPEISSLKEDEPIPKEILGKLRVTKEDFDYALRMVPPSAMREVLVEIPKVKWGDVGGLEEVKEALKEAVEWPLKNADSFKRLGIKPPRGILLYGPPGCGKTYIVKALANEAGVNFIAVKGPEIMTMWVGESERKLRDIFRRAKQVAPAIILFDEIDALAPRRGIEVGTRVTEQVVSQLLAEMSGIEEIENVVVIATTNRPDIVDPALLRPGRFDRLIYVPAPDEKTRLEIFKVHTREMPLKGVSLDKLAKEADGYSGADIEALAREAAMFALREDQKAKEITMKQFEKALKKVKPSITEDISTKYQKAVEDLKKTKMEEVRYIG